MSPSIRIIGGQARGRWLYRPTGRATRPMLVRIRNSLFNIIRPRLEGAKILDLFAGIGTLGLEALSRGAGFCLFTERNKESYHIIKKNVERLGFSNQSKVVLLDAFHIMDFLASQKFYPDLIFVSPPYCYFDKTASEKDRLLKLMDEMVQSGLVNAEGLFIVEHTSKQLQEISSGHLTLSDRRAYGQTVLSFLRPREDLP